MATFRILSKLGIPVSLSEVMAEGRASLSQGLIETAQKRAKQTALYLYDLIENGCDIVVSEPSVLAMFRLDYKNLIGNDELFEKIKINSYDPFEYITEIFDAGSFKLDDYFDTTKSSCNHLFYHGHCQQKTIGASEAAASFFEKLGFDVVPSSVECCGMAGSFGYKKDYYELSMKVGEDLINQIEQADQDSGKRILLASGTSCREQIQSFLKREVFHPIEFLEKLMK
jgi:Fe-S oxidoreductase